MVLNDYRVVTYDNQTETSGIARYRCVVLATTGNRRCKYPGGAAAANFVGVTCEATSAVGAIAVQVDGIAKVMCSEQISVGDWLKIAGTSGKVMPADNATAAATEVVGQAESASTADGGLIYMRILPHIRTI